MQLQTRSSAIAVHTNPVLRQVLRTEKRRAQGEEEEACLGQRLSEWIALKML